MVVMPLYKARRPDSRSVCMPCRLHAARSSSVEAPAEIMSRRSSFMMISS